MYRQNHHRIIESMQASLDAEMKSKNDCIKQKKKLETDISQLEICLNATTKQLTDLQKTNKKLQQTMSELNSQLEDEQSQKVELRELTAAAERRVQTCMSELEDTRSLLEQADRSRKSVEQELSDAADRIAELAASGNNLNLVKRQCENSMAQFKNEYDEIVVELKNSEERVKRSTLDAARLMEELRTEQVRSILERGKFFNIFFVTFLFSFSKEHSVQAEKVRRNLEVQVSDLQSRLDSAESTALKGGKKIIQKLEQRVG